MQARPQCAVCHMSMPRGMDMCYACWREAEDRNVTYCRDCGNTIVRTWGSPVKLCTSCHNRRERLEAEQAADTAKILADLAEQRKSLIAVDNPSVGYYRT